MPFPRPGVQQVLQLLYGGWRQGVHDKQRRRHQPQLLRRLAPAQGHHAHQHSGNRLCHVRNGEERETSTIEDGVCQNED